MNRLPLSLGLSLLGTLIGSPIVRAQEAPKTETPKQQVVQGRSKLKDTVQALPTKPEQESQVVIINGQEFVKNPFPKQFTQSKTYTRQPPTFTNQKRQVVLQRELPLTKNFGLTLADADDTLRSQLDIPNGEGVVIVSVKPESLADHAGLKPMDVLLTLGGKPVKDVNDASKTLMKLTKEALPVKLIRMGKPTQLSVVGPEHGVVAEATEYWIGVPVTPVDATLRAHLSSLGDGGLIANDIVKGSPAEAAGLKKNDILISLGGSKPLKDSPALIAAIQASEGKPVALEILRAGKPMTLTVTPAKRASSTAVASFWTDEVLTTFDVKLPKGAQDDLQDANQTYAWRYLQLIPPYVTVEVDPAAQKTGGNSQNPVTSKVEVQLFDDQNQAVIDPQALKKQIHESIQLRLKANPPHSSPEERTARIEAELKEAMTKLDAILELLKKSEKK